MAWGKETPHYDKCLSLFDGSVCYWRELRGGKVELASIEDGRMVHTMMSKTRFGGRYVLPHHAPEHLRERAYNAPAYEQVMAKMEK